MATNPRACSPSRSTSTHGTIDAAGATAGTTHSRTSSTTLFSRWSTSASPSSPRGGANENRKSSDVTRQSAASTKNKQRFEPSTTPSKPGSTIRTSDHSSQPSKRLRARGIARSGKNSHLDSGCPGRARANRRLEATLSTKATRIFEKGTEKKTQTKLKKQGAFFAQKGLRWSRVLVVARPGAATASPSM
jgi:hypothetical protein